MTSWAECSRGLPLAKPPQHARTVFKRDNQSPSISYKAHEIISNGISGAKIFKFVSDNTCGSGNVEKPIEALRKWVEPKRKTEVIYSTFCFTEDIIQDLKQRSGASSSFVAVAAQFWRCATRAREVPEEEAVCFVLLGDCRGRFKPPLPPTYFGNCLSLGLAQTKANILIDSDISFAADVIQQLINSCSSEAQINYLIDWAESPDRDFVTLLTEAGWQYGINISFVRYGLWMGEAFGCPDCHNERNWNHVFVMRKGWREKHCRLHLPSSTPDGNLTSPSLRFSRMTSFLQGAHFLGENRVTRFAQDMLSTLLYCVL